MNKEQFLDELEKLLQDIEMKHLIIIVITLKMQEVNMNKKL